MGAAEALADAGYAIDRDAIVEGLESVEWPGRMEVLGREPTLVVDGAHNDHSMATLLATLDAYVPHRNLIVVAGFSRDKQVDAMVELLAQRSADRVIATRSRHPALHAAGRNRRTVPGPGHGPRTASRITGAYV